ISLVRRLATPWMQRAAACSVINADTNLLPTRSKRRSWPLIVLTFSLLSQFYVNSIQAQENVGLTVPEGFSVSLYADDDLAHDIYSLTVDSQGRVVVAGRGYVRILIDEDGDGKAEKYKQFSEVPANGAMGMFFLGGDLICTGDSGLLRLRDADHDDQADGPPDVFLKVKTGSEHDAHAIRRGPDGWWYLICGNTANVSAGYATLPTSPVKRPQFGTILRLKPDLTGGEIYAHGFRNAYDFDFGPAGDPYTFDSDDERDSSLPWYRPTRVFEVLPGMNAGWQAQSWKRPDYFFDMMPVTASFGRGSPTGVSYYQHTHFPEPYRGALFAMDWTFGRVMALPLQRAGEVWQTAPIDFIQAKGEFGFAPTDCEIGPDGSLYVSVGGRGTRGGVYRITHPEGLKAWLEQQKMASKDKLTMCLTAPQPLSSWSRAQWEPLAKELGREELAKAAINGELPAASRIRAIEILTEKFGGLDAAMAVRLLKAPEPEVRARLAWSLERILPPQLPQEVWLALVQDPDPLVRRMILETITTHAVVVPVPILAPGLRLALGDPQRFVHVTAAKAVAALNPAGFQLVGAEVRKGDWQTALSYGYANYLRNLGDGSKINAYAVELGRTVLDSNQHSPALKLQAARLIQLGLGDLGPRQDVQQAYWGYTSTLDLTAIERQLDPVRVAVTKYYPTQDKALNDELTRLMAMLTVFNDPALNSVLAQITSQSDPVDDIHNLLVASRIPVERGKNQRQVIAQALVSVEPKLMIRKMVQDTNWPDRFAELYGTLVDLDPELPQAILEQPGFGRPGHILFISRFPPEMAPLVQQKFAAAIAADSEYPWNNDVVFLIGESRTPDSLIQLRNRFEHYNTRNAALICLAKRGLAEDREKFFEGLGSSQPEVMRSCLEAIEKLPPRPNPPEVVALVKSLRRLGTEQNEFQLRERVVTLLERCTGKRYPFVRGPEGHRPQPESIKSWTDLAILNFPQFSNELLGGAGSELADLKVQLAKVDWTTGNVTRGRKLFTERSCSQCHGSGQALGPSLVGIAGRFSREDLFVAITLPDRDVSPRYQATTVETKQGLTHTGLVVYESAEGIILRDITNRTFRLETHEIESKYRHNKSLMPNGLLKGLQPQDLADLYRYLQTVN
ncbi:MAG: Cytochrome c, partial [Planctomycetaceae bacterium]|nr:Cytochrome c [Planctomycetaceae bacterium]